MYNNSPAFTNPANVVPSNNCSSFDCALKLFSTIFPLLTVLSKKSKPLCSLLGSAVPKTASPSVLNHYLITTMVLNGFH